MRPIRPWVMTRLWQIHFNELWAEASCTHESKVVVFSWWHLSSGNKQFEMNPQQLCLSSTIQGPGYVWQLGIIREQFQNYHTWNSQQGLHSTRSCKSVFRFGWIRNSGYTKFHHSLLICLDNPWPQESQNNPPQLSWVWVSDSGLRNNQVVSLWACGSINIQGQTCNCAQTRSVMEHWRSVSEHPNLALSFASKGDWKHAL